MSGGGERVPDQQLSGFLVDLATALGDHDQARVIAENTCSCQECAGDEAGRYDVDELPRSLDAIENLVAAPALSQVLVAAQARRRPAPPVPTFATPFAASAGMLESVLAEVSEDVLRLPGPVLTWRVGDLVPHLAAGNALLASALGLSVEPAPGTAADLVGHTERLLATVASWPRQRVQALWRGGVESIATLLRARPEIATELITVNGLPTTVGNHLIARAFETWIHARDIGAAAGLRVPPPPADSLGAMANLAARLLSALPARSATAPVGTVRLTLTGPGGGSWPVHVGAAASGAPSAGTASAGLSLNTVEFCLLVADRRHPTQIRAEIEGDRALAAELLAIAPQLATP